MFWADGLCLVPGIRGKFRELEKPREGCCGQSTESEEDGEEEVGVIERRQLISPLEVKGCTWMLLLQDINEMSAQRCDLYFIGNTLPTVQTPDHRGAEGSSTQMRGDGVLSRVVAAERGKLNPPGLIEQRIWRRE